MLTAKKPGSAPCPTLVIEYGNTLLFYTINTSCPTNRREILHGGAATYRTGLILLWGQ